MSEQNARDDAILCRHFADLCRISAESSVPRYSFFLNEHEQALALRKADEECVPYLLWGGYADAHRRMICFGEAGEDDFPLKAATFSFRKADSLSHRDFLGALMSLGIKRELVGDILVGEGYCILFVADGISDMLKDEVAKIGRVGVKLTMGINAPIPEAKFSEQEGVVASLRLDGVLSEMLAISRDKSSKLINGGLVCLNGIPCEENKHSVQQDDIISVRGYGRYTLSEIGAITKKGKIRIKFKKFL